MFDRLSTNEDNLSEQDSPALAQNQPETHSEKGSTKLGAILQSMVDGVRRHSEGQPDWPCCSYISAAELIEAVGKLTTDYDFRKELGRKARKYVSENHTYRHRAEKMIESCKRLMPSG